MSEWQIIQWEIPLHRFNVHHLYYWFQQCRSLNDELDDLTDHHRTVSKERDDLVNIVEGLEQEIAEAKVNW